MKKVFLKMILAASLYMASSKGIVAQSASKVDSIPDHEKFELHPSQELQFLYNEVRQDMGLPKAPLMTITDQRKNDMGDLYAVRRYDPSKPDSVDFNVVMTQNFAKFLSEEDLKIFLAHEEGHEYWYLNEKAKGISAREFFGRDSLLFSELQRDERFADSVALATYGYEKFIKAFDNLATKELYLQGQSLRRFIRQSKDFCILTGTTLDPIVAIDWDKFPKDALKYDEKMQEMFPWAQLLAESKEPEQHLHMLVVSAALMNDFNVREQTDPAGSFFSRLARANYWKHDHTPLSLGNKGPSNTHKGVLDNGNVRQTQHRR